MKAETIYTVIQALSEDELPRLYELLGVEVSIKEKVSSKTKKVKVSEAMDKILVRYFNVRRTP